MGHRLASAGTITAGGGCEGVAAAGGRAADGPCRKQSTFPIAVALAVPLARRRLVAGAFSVGVGGRGNRPTTAVLGAGATIGTGHAEIGACGFAAEPVDAEPGRAAGAVGALNAERRFRCVDRGVDRGVDR